MESILKIPLLQYNSEHSDIKIFSVKMYKNKFIEINNNLKDIYFNTSQKISINDYIKKEYDNFIDLIKFIIYSNLPFTSLNRDYNLNFSRISGKDKILLDSIVLKLNDIINVQLNIMIKVNQKDYINLTLNKEDNDEILDIISRNYWFQKREDNIQKRYGIKKEKINWNKEKNNKICYFE